MKKIILAILIAILFVSCNNGDVSPFEIGDSRDEVFNTIVDNFTIHGERWSKGKITDEMNFDTENLQTWITLYDCIYKGQEYNKIRVVFDVSRKVCRMQLKIEKAKMKNMHRRLVAKYGESRRANIPGLFGSWEIVTVYMGDVEGVVVTEESNVYELNIVSGEQYYELKRFL